MTYAKTNDDGDAIVEYPLIEDEIKARFPNVSWPVHYFDPPETYVKIADVTQPDFDSNLFTIKLDTPVRIDNVWTMNWLLTPIDQAVIDARGAELLKNVKQTRIAYVNEGAAALLNGGFHSSALGSSHLYPSTQTDQLNLIANVMSSQTPNIPDDWTTLQICEDDKGIWDRRPHTASEIQQVGNDAKAAMQMTLAYKDILINAINSIDMDDVNKSIEAINAVAWPANS